MANKVLKLTGIKKADPNLEVYVDISTTSTFNKNIKKPHYTDKRFNYLATLNEENPTQLNAIGVIVQDEQSGNIDKLPIGFNVHAKTTEAQLAELQKCTDNQLLFLATILEDRELDSNGQPMLTEDDNKKLLLYFDDPEKFNHMLSIFKINGHRLTRLVNLKAISNSLKQIFTWMPGERIINPEFGSNIKLLLYEGLTDENRERVTAEIQRSISMWEPRVNITQIQDVTNIDDIEDNTVHIEVIYSVPTLSNEQFNYSYYYSKFEK